MEGTNGQATCVLRRFLPLFALLLTLAAPTLAEARAGGGYTSGRGSVPIRSNSPRIGVRQVSGGGVRPVTPAPPPTAFPTVQQIINNNAVVPAGNGVSPTSTAAQGTSTAAPTPASSRRSTSVTRTPPLIVTAVVLILAAGSFVTIGGFFAVCRYIRRREREQLRAWREEAMAPSPVPSPAQTGER